MPSRAGTAVRPATDALPGRVDVLVIGAGITGAGVALDAAHRGASVLLVDRGDLASGTSSRSSRLVHGGVRYLDCRTDDARLTLAVAQAAAEHGATVAPHVAVTALEAHQGRIGRAHLRDVLRDEDHVVDARFVVSSAGVWAGEVHGLGPTGDRPLEVVGARGIHLVFDRHDLPVDAAVVVPSVRGDGRRLFVIAWGQQVYVGTTDVPHEGGLDGVTVSRADADYVLAPLTAAFDVDLAVDDAVGAWVGLHPLLRGAAGAATADLSRRHAVVHGPPGLVSVTGGKLTTFRAMAADVVDGLAREAGWPRRSGTTALRLGSDGPPATGRARVATASVAAGVDPWFAAGLHHRHGNRAPAVLELAREHEETDALVDGLPYLAGEVRWAARHERVGRLDDVLSRRLRLSTRHRAAGGPAAVRRAADIAGEELGWSPRRREAEVAGCLEAVRTERGPVPLTV